jgi:glutaredoxin
MSNKSEVGIRLLTLGDCDYCEWLKSELDGCGLTYENIDAYKFPEFADKIEDKFKTKSYPIVFIDLGVKVITIVSETELETSDKLLTFDTIPDLINIIKRYI